MALVEACLVGFLGSGLIPRDAPTLPELDVNVKMRLERKRLARSPNTGVIPKPFSPKTARQKSLRNGEFLRRLFIMKTIVLDENWKRSQDSLEALGGCTCPAC